MAKQLRFEYNKKAYTLEFTRATASAIERSGFVADQIGEKPNMMIPLLWYGAFAAHHSSVKREVMDSIYDKMKDKKSLIAKLVEMYQDTLVSLLDDPDEDSEGNLSWTADWE